MPDAISVFRRLGLIWTRIIRPLAVASALVLLTACSAIKLAYNNVQDLGYWWIDGYTDLNETQTLRLRADLARLHDWHRANELLLIAGLLQQIQRDATADATAPAMCQLFDAARNRLEAVRTQAEPGAVALAMALTQEQITHIEKRFDKTNAEWRREWAAGERADRQAKRLKASVERAEEFYGTLDENQRAVLQAGLARSRFDPQRSYAERLRRQQDLLQTVRTVSGTNGAPPPTVALSTVALRAYLDRSVQSPDPAYRSYAENAVQENCRTYAQLHNSTTAQQRARAVARLAGYERDARELARVP